ncbi:Transcriptional coactivator HFI1/ADA1 [Yarrowia sp. B02]|nr:Transcriptional coactivator HFI1/ADA1 [Yarrowia sp. B02]
MSDMEDDSLLGIPDKEESVEVEVKQEDTKEPTPKVEEKPEQQQNGIAPSMMGGGEGGPAQAPSMSIAPGSIGGGGGVAAAAAETAATPSATPAASTPGPSSSRLQVDDMMGAFQKQLGPNWDRYRDVLTHFLVGRLSRHELQEALDGILDRSMVKMHNQFLLANLCNSLRAAPADGATGRMTSWSRKRGRGGAGAQKVKGDTQMAQLKKEVLSLPPRERKRIKAITREAGKKGYIASTIINTRQAMLPRIPFVHDKDAVGKVGNTVTWTQDIIHAYQTQLATESRELPDADHLRSRMVGIALEHGVLGGLGQNVVELIQVGLEYYLKGIIQETVEMVKLRKIKDKEAIATAADMAVVLESTPNLTVETCAPVYRLNNVMLQNDEVLEEMRPKEEPVGDKKELNHLLDDLLGDF